MKETTFHRILIAITVLGALSILALVAYTWMLHSNCSILTYIANRS